MALSLLSILSCRPGGKQRGDSAELRFVTAFLAALSHLLKGRQDVEKCSDDEKRCKDLHRLQSYI